MQTIHQVENRDIAVAVLVVVALMALAYIIGYGDGLVFALS